MALTNIETTIILDLYDHDTTPTKIKAIALDSKTRYVLASLRDNGNVYDAGQNTSVTLTIIRPDNTGVQITGETRQIVDLAPEGEVTVYGVYAELSQAALAVKGTLRAQFMLTSGDQILRTEIFAISCGEALDASTDTWAGEYQGYNLDELVQNVNESSAKVDAMEQDVSELKSGFSDLYNTAYVTDSASGAVAHFEDGADNVPLKSLKVNIEPVQSGSGDPSPDNVRPISGWDSVKVTRAGKNLFPSKGLTQTLNGITIRSNDDGSFTVNGTATANAQFELTLNNELKLQSGQYTVDLLADKAVTFDPQHVWWFFYSMDAHADIVNCQSPSKTFTLNAVTATRFYLRIISGTTVDNVTLYPMLVYGSDAPTEFEPYNGNTYNISLSSAGTVYGGTLDVVSGVLTVTHGYILLDGTQRLGLTNWRATENSIGWVYPYLLTNHFVDRADVIVPDIKSDKLPTIAYSVAFAGSSIGISAVSSTTGESGYGIAVRVADTSLTNETAINAYLAENPIQVVYKLATPQTYQLTPIEVKSLLGINNVWSDAGDVTAEYRADTKLFIERLTEPNSADMIADTNITSGKYFMVGNNLYLATANIASGGQVIVGTNAIRKSLSEALNEINA